MPVLGLATAAALGVGELEEAAGAGLDGGFDATDPGDAAVEGGGLAAFAEATAPEEAGAPCVAGEPVGEGLSSSFGARAPMFARSWPTRIFPRKTGRSKM
jgi:hypothetical protein